MGKDGQRHRPKLLQGIEPHTFEQFRSRHVTDGGTLRFFLLFGRIVERIAQERVGVPMITLVGRDDGIECFGKSNFLHGKGAGREGNERYDNQQPPT